MRNRKKGQGEVRGEAAQLGLKTVFGGDWILFRFLYLVSVVVTVF